MQHCWRWVVPYADIYIQPCLYADNVPENNVTLIAHVFNRGAVWKQRFYVDDRGISLTLSHRKVVSSPMWSCDIFGYQMNPAVRALLANNDAVCRDDNAHIHTYTRSVVCSLSLREAWRWTWTSSLVTTVAGLQHYRADVFDICNVERGVDAYLFRLSGNSRMFISRRVVRNSVANHSMSQFLWVNSTKGTNEPLFATSIGVLPLFCTPRVCIFFVDDMLVINANRLLLCVMHELLHTYSTSNHHPVIHVMTFEILLAVAI